MDLQPLLIILMGLALVVVLFRVFPRGGRQEAGQPKAGWEQWRDVVIPVLVVVAFVILLILAARGT